MPITRRKIIRVMADVVDDVGDEQTNPAPQYFIMGGQRDGLMPVPCCLVGHVLAELGVDGEDWYATCQQYNTTAIDALTVDIEQLIGDTIEPNGWDALLEAQHLADGGDGLPPMPWSKIVTRLEKRQ